VLVHGGRAHLPDATTLPLPEGTHAAGAALLGIRPEMLAWLPADAPDAAVELRGRAAVVEPLGAETLVTLDIAGHEVHARVPPRRVRAAGEAVRLGVDPEMLHLFAADEGGKRL
jgi:ABC-type sugar transport system ATPase subunit